MRIRAWLCWLCAVSGWCWWSHPLGPHGHAMRDWVQTVTTGSKQTIQGFFWCCVVHMWGACCAAVLCRCRCCVEALLTTVAWVAVLLCCCFRCSF